MAQRVKDERVGKDEKMHMEQKAKWLIRVGNKFEALCSLAEITDPISECIFFFFSHLSKTLKQRASEHIFNCFGYTVKLEMS